ncbi:beta strand repeat-containing protein, partial [Flavobacterium pedocola]
YQICEKLNPTNCDPATVTVTVTPPVIIAQNDTINGGNGTTGNPNAGNVLNNNGNGFDTLNGSNVAISQVNLTVTTPATPIGNNPVPIISTTTGQVSVPAGTPAGTYTLVYQICEKLNPTNCDPATVTVTVTAPAIIAQNDTISGGNGTTGNPNAGNVLNNNGNGPDTLNGSPVAISQVNLTVTTPATPIGNNPVPSISTTTGQVSVPAGTPAGTYTLVYQICEKLNPNNCDSANVTVTVAPPPIVATDDPINGGNGTSGNPNVGNVLNNDTLNGNPVSISQVNLTITTTATPIGNNPVPLISPSNGQVSVPPGTPAGTYTMVYQICEKLNPNNCDPGTVTVTVSSPLIIAQDDTINGGNGTTGNPNAGNVLNNNGNGNDTLNGINVAISQVNLTVTTPATPIGNNPVPSISTTTGQVSVPAGTPAGTYTLVYQICEKLNPTNCDPASVTVTVAPPVIIAQDDTINGGNVTTGNPNAGNVLSNNGNGFDTLNGSNVAISQVNLTVTTPATPIGNNPVPSISTTTGQVSVPPGTPAATYTMVYQICEKLNPNNCDSATVSVTVACDQFAAPTASVTAQPTCTVATGTITVTVPAPASGISYTVTGTNPVVAAQSNTTGIFPNLNPGVYAVTYTKLNCTSAATSLTVNAQPATPAKPTLSAVTQPTCTNPNGSFTITNYNSSYTYTVSPSNTGATISGNTITAPAGTYTVTATLGNC